MKKLVLLLALTLLPGFTFAADQNIAVEQIQPATQAESVSAYMKGFQAFMAWYIRNGSQYQSLDQAYDAFMLSPDVDKAYKDAVVASKAQVFEAINAMKYQINNIHTELDNKMQELDKQNKSLMDTLQKDLNNSVSKMGSTVDSFLENMYSNPPSEVPNTAVMPEPAK